MGPGSWRGTPRRIRSTAGAVALAFTLLVPGVMQSTPIAAADSLGELVVQAAPGKSIADVNRKFGSVTELAIVNSTPTVVTQALVKSQAVNATYAAMQADAKSATPTVGWVEPNVAADEPRAQDDSGADPYCPKPPADLGTSDVNGQDDSGADGRCTRQIPIGGLLHYPNQYGVSRAAFDRAQTVEKGDGIIVAVLDTQVDALHPTFLLRTIGGLDLLGASLFTTLSTKGADHGHGTFVAGVVLRAAPAAKIMPVRVLDDDGRGSTAQVAAGIRWAVAHHADVINMSLDTPTDSRVLREAVAYALSQNVVLVAAYGNEGKNSPAVYPADYPGVISVMATDQDDVRASFSNYGRPGVVAAPGVNIISTYPQGLFAVGSGTSYAAPWVAGEAALILDHNANLTPAQVLTQIQKTADDVSGANGGTKFTRINSYRALGR
jgi:subtilisin family serine protease